MYQQWKRKVERGCYLETGDTRRTAAADFGRLVEKFGRGRGGKGRGRSHGPQSKDYSLHHFLFFLVVLKNQYYIGSRNTTIDRFGNLLVLGTSREGSRETSCGHAQLYLHMRRPVLWARTALFALTLFGQRRGVCVSAKTINAYIQTSLRQFSDIYLGQVRCMGCVP